MAEGAALPPPFDAPAAEIAPPPRAALRTGAGARTGRPAGTEVTPPPLPAAVAEPVPVGWEQRLGARAFLWIGAITLALAAVFLVRYSIEEGYLSPEVRVILAALFGFALIGGAERMRTPRRPGRPGAGRRRRRFALRRAVRGRGALRDDLQGRGRRWCRGAHRLRHRPVAAPRHPRGGAGLRRRLRQSRHHRQRDAQHAGPVRLPPGDRRRDAGRHSRARLVAARLGRARGLGDLDGRSGCCPLAGGLHWVGLFLVALSGLFVWATWRRMGESENPPADVAALVWAALGLSGVLLVAVIVQDDGRAKRRLAGAGGAWRGPLSCSAAGRRASSTSRRLAPPLSIAALAAVVGHARAAWARRGMPIASPGSRSCLGGFYAAGAFALCVERGPAGILGGAFRRRRARSLSSLLVRAARRGDRHAVGPDQHRTLPCPSWSAPNGWCAGAKP